MRMAFAWALERGLSEVTWTFDPLVRRNAWFNIEVLGGHITEYVPNFYGTMSDSINAQIAAFLKSGGEIQQIAKGVSGQTFGPSKQISLGKK